ncbi:hypothetical protein HA138_13020 [Mycobacteroides chelonae]|uniref:hypothetical protein n=1 Tax=Mycobacteroides chelonae TaxID=1774 RepID=UPI0018B03EB4|nr:hypothetical protein [Mycobacteroides chelonae]MBF9350681.1 hypothetical protein [Mycobacteroides chelonae]
MLVFDEQIPALSDEFEGDEVTLLAVRGGRVDKHFRRNYSWAKHAADCGKLKKIRVVVEITADSWVHTVGAVTSALSGQRLHSSGEFRVFSPMSMSVAGTAEKVNEALKELAPIRQSVAEVKPAPRANEPRAKVASEKNKEGARNEGVRA